MRWSVEENEKGVSGVELGAPSWKIYENKSYNMKFINKEALKTKIEERGNRSSIP